MNGLLKAGIVQFATKPGDTAENLGRVLAGLRALAEDGADIAVLPELWSRGFHGDIAADARETPVILEAMAETAAACGLVIAGSLAESTGQGIFNTLYVHDRDGSLAGKYRKIHLFSAIGEDRLLLPGDRAVVCNTTAGTFGLLICYDIRFPELGRTLALKGAEGLIVCARWPSSRIRHWAALLCARAIENQVIVLAANSCGQHGPIEFGGRSMIVAATGEVAASADGTEPAVIHAVLDESEKVGFRKAIPCLRERRPETYDLK